MDDFQITEFPKSRLATIDLGRLWRSRHSMHALLEVDATNARRAARGLRREGHGPSFTAWMVKAIALCAAANPEAHAARLGRRRLVLFKGVDIGLPVERMVGAARVPLALLIKDADRKSVLEIGAEIDDALGRTVSGERDFILSAHGFSAFALRLYYNLPQWIRLFIFRRLFKNPFRARKHSGSVMMTTVNAAGKTAGWILPTRTMHNLSIAVGSITPKPWVVDGKVAVRDILHLTVSFDHDVIDGMPAARFIKDLTAMIEKGVLET